jgi:hypothetical protein
MKLYKKIIMSLLAVLPFILFGCLIEDVSQPASVEAGGTFTTVVTITDMNAEQQNAHKGVIAILVPEDWSFIDGTYDTPMGAGDMVLDTATPPVWGDVDTIDGLAAPSGMKWINLLSDTGYLHTANMVYEATINLQVGQTTGEFPIGYLTTVNTIDMLKFLNDQDEDQQLSGADTSMNHMVTVTPLVGIKEQLLEGVPDEYNLSQNYPNPFNPSTTINYSVIEGSYVRLAVYDAAGKEVKLLADGFKQRGNYSVTFTADNMASGIYYYKIMMDGFSKTHKMVLLK